MFVLIKVVRFINNMHYFDKGGVIYKLYTLLTKSSEQIKDKMYCNFKKQPVDEEDGGWHMATRNLIILN